MALQQWKVARGRSVILCICMSWVGPAIAGPANPAGMTSPVAADAKILIETWKASDRTGTSRPVISVPINRPVESFRYTSPFGTRTDPFRGNSSFHPGVDLAAPVGTPVYATGDAMVSRAGPAAGYGNLVVLLHGAGIETRYGHLSRVLVKVGQTVRRGEMIGLVGSTGRSTGNHLHYEIRVADQAINPLLFMAPGDEQLALNAAVGSSAGKTSAMGGPEGGGARIDRLR